MSYDKQCNFTESDSDKTVTKGDYYRHYKGGLYCVDGFATHTETGDLLVLYHEVGNANFTWARPIEHWLSPTQHGYERFKRETQYEQH